MRITRSSSSSSGRMRLVLIITISVVLVRSVEGLWCVGRSDASDEELQKGLDYACEAGADCTPIQENGLCFLPNTLQAHASYAFNSFFQRSFMAPSSCEFSHTATLAKTDPSYGSCVYPASPRRDNIEFYTNNKPKSLWKWKRDPGHFKHQWRNRNRRWRRCRRRSFKSQQPRSSHNNHHKLQSSFQFKNS